MTASKPTRIYTNVFPRVAIPAPHKKYPEWLERTLENPNIPVPEYVIEAQKPVTIKTPGMPPRTLGGEPAPPPLYVPPPAEVHQKPKMPVRFRVLSSFGTPIFGFTIRANDQNLVTGINGEAPMEVYQGLSLAFSTGMGSGWTIPKGATRKTRMMGLVPISQMVPVSTPMTITLYPEAGEWENGDGVVRQQAITYATSWK